LLGRLLGLGDFAGPTVDGFLQVVAVALHRVSELVTEQLADVDAVDDHVTHLPLTVDFLKGVLHRIHQIGRAHV